jgi:hypothetical protein
MSESSYHAVLITPGAPTSSQTVDAEYIQGKPQESLETYQSIEGVLVVQIFRLDEPQSGDALPDVFEYVWESTESIDAP